MVAGLVSFCVLFFTKLDLVEPVVLGTPYSSAALLILLPYFIASKAFNIDSFLHFIHFLGDSREGGIEEARIFCLYSRFP